MVSGVLSLVSVVAFSFCSISYHSPHQDAAVLLDDFWVNKGGVKDNIETELFMPQNATCLLGLAEDDLLKTRKAVEFENTTLEALRTRRPLSLSTNDHHKSGNYKDAISTSIASVSTAAGGVGDLGSVPLSLSSQNTHSRGTANRADPNPSQTNHQSEKKTQGTMSPDSESRKTKTENDSLRTSARPTPGFLEAQARERVASARYRVSSKSNPAHVDVIGTSPTGSARPVPNNPRQPPALSPINSQGGIWQQIKDACACPGFDMWQCCRAPQTN